MNTNQTKGSESPLMARDLGGYLRVGILWVNDHTGEETAITELAARTERVPDPRGGFRDEQEFVVHHTAGVPPGFAGGHGWSLREFLRHWQPKAVRRDA